MTKPRILAVGGAHVDRRGQVSGAFVPGASNPGTLREDFGAGRFRCLTVRVDIVNVYVHTGAHSRGCCAVAWTEPTDHHRRAAGFEFRVQDDTAGPL